MDQNCTCFVKHALTREEREAATAALDYARRIGDSTGIAIALAQLDTATCPASLAAAMPRLDVAHAEAGVEPNAKVAYCDECGRKLRPGFEIDGEDEDFADDDWGHGLPPYNEALDSDDQVSAEEAIAAALFQTTPGSVEGQTLVDAVAAFIPPSAALDADQAQSLYEAVEIRLARVVAALWFNEKRCAEAGRLVLQTIVARTNPEYLAPADGEEK